MYAFETIFTEFYLVFYLSERRREHARRKRKKKSVLSEGASYSGPTLLMKLTHEHRGLFVRHSAV